MSGSVPYPKAALGRHLPDRPAAKLLLAEPAPEWWRLMFDGGVRGNGRPDATGTWAYRLLDSRGVLVARSSGPAVGNPVTVNTAEWDGLLAGLFAAEAGRPPVGLLVEGDSDLVIAQVTGRWRVKKPALEAALGRAIDLLGRIGRPWTARWVPRSQNEDCDRMTKPPKVRRRRGR